MPSTRRATLLIASVFAGVLVPLCAAGQTVSVVSAADMPRFSYPVKTGAAQLLESDDATFQAFADQVRRDLESTLAGYRIEDKSTLAELLKARLGLEELVGDYAGGLKTVDALRALDQKTASKLLTGLYARARLQAALDAGAASGPAYERAFQRRYGDAIGPLPWDVVQDGVRVDFAFSQMLSRAAILAEVMTELEPAAAASRALDSAQAWALIQSRVALKADLPISFIRADVLRAYIAKNEVPKANIWSAREVDLTAADNLTPVNVAIWDSGVDLSLFQQRLFSDPQPTSSGAHGLAFNDLGDPSTDWLYPIDEAAKAAYPGFQEMMQGFLDLQDGVDSEPARAVRRKFQTMSPDEMHAMSEAQKVLGFYAHGTHCAGIAVRGNPAARLVVARFNDQLSDFPFPPDELWVQHMAKAFAELGQYFRTRNVRVVNMSWADNALEFETWLSKTGGSADPQVRKTLAAQLFAGWKAAIRDAIRAAPNTLFIAAAGNSNSNVGFIEDVPASLREPNLITVGALNQSGEETSFTSHGEEVSLHANGYQVESVVPGGGRLRLSGTSMAAPQVTNLAAKLFALNPGLTPAQVIELIKAGATDSPDRRRHLINPKQSVALLKPK